MRFAPRVIVGSESDGSRVHRPIFHRIELAGLGEGSEAAAVVSAAVPPCADFAVDVVIFSRDRACQLDLVLSSRRVYGDLKGRMSYAPCGNVAAASQLPGEGAEAMELFRCALSPRCVQPPSSATLRAVPQVAVIFHSSSTSFADGYIRLQNLQQHARITWVPEVHSGTLLLPPPPPLQASAGACCYRARDVPGGFEETLRRQSAALTAPLLMFLVDDIIFVHDVDLESEQLHRLVRPFASGPL